MAVRPARKRHDEDEPATPVAARVGARQLQALDAGEGVPVARRDFAPGGEHLLEPRELGEADRTRDLREAVVEAQPVVVQPAHVARAPLVSLRLYALPESLPVAHHHPALARRQLLVRIEGEDRRVAAPADGAPVRVHRPERLASVLHDGDPRPGGELLQRVQIGGVAEDVNRQKRSRARAHRRLRRVRVDVQGHGVDVGEHRPRTLVEHRVR